MEARPGFEPGSADLQSAAWPLCYRAEDSVNESMNGGSSSSRTKYSEEAGLQPAAVASAAHDPGEWRSTGESNPWLPPGQGGTLATELAERKEKEKDGGAHGRIRTFNRWVWSPVLCQLSYTRVNTRKKQWSEWQDLNLQPPPSKAGRLPD